MAIRSHPGVLGPDISTTTSAYLGRQGAHRRHVSRQGCSPGLRRNPRPSSSTTSSPLLSSFSLSTKVSVLRGVRFLLRLLSPPSLPLLGRLLPVLGLHGASMERSSTTTRIAMSLGSRSLKLSAGMLAGMRRPVVHVPAVCSKL